MGWASFLLRPEPRESQPAPAARGDYGRRIAEMEPRAAFRPRPEGAMTAASSLAAQEAARAVRDQGAEAFSRYHRRLFRAHFQEGRDIGTPDDLAALAVEEGLDPEPIQVTLHDHRYRERVFAEYRQALSLGIRSIPTVLFVAAERVVPVVGAVPLEIYHNAIQLLTERSSPP